MAGSQLKRLKASLREQGITGPQQSKKQRRKNAEQGKARSDKRLQRGVVLEGIREQFNPFDLKHAARGPKFDVTTNRVATGDAAKGIRGRPGVARAAGEERRRETLLVDMQRRNKIGGILDRRFGEYDPTMAPEDKMLERFAREKQRSHKKSSIFDLEDDVPMEGGLTHGGKALEFDDDELVDDFQEHDLDISYDSDGSMREVQRLKRLRSLASADKDEGEQDEPERKKSKKEVMEEIIAKSKMHKYERQAAKDVDEDMRVELDKELQSIQMLLRSTKGSQRESRSENPQMSSIAGVERAAFDRNFDFEVKKLAQDKRAQPTERTKTEEEKAEEESRRLKELEDRRQRRMRGEEVTDSEEEEEEKGKAADTGGMEVDDDDDDFGLGSGIRARRTATELGFDDEDDFIIDDDLVASGSNLEPVDSDEELEEEDDDTSQQNEVDEEDEFTKGLLNEEEARNPMFRVIDSDTRAAAARQSDEQGLPYTFPCPQSCNELQAIIAGYSHEFLPVIVQRIRALHHPKLDSQNKEKLGNFAMALVDFVALPWDEETSPPFAVLESLIRHIHSLSKMFPTEVGRRFRHHISDIGQDRPLALRPSDLVVLTAISTIFPTSDHFHQVVTPSLLTMGRFLGQKVPQNLCDYATGAYLAILCLKYQQLSKRFIPEVPGFCLNTLCALSPSAPSKQLGNFPRHGPPAGIRSQKIDAVTVRKLTLADCAAVDSTSDSAKAAIIATMLDILDAGADLWAGKEAFLETFGQVAKVLKHVSGKTCRPQLPAQVVGRADKLIAKLGRMLSLAQISRRPLELHHHRPLAIKTYIPKFEETFDPDKHYDPDRERAELAKLKAEHKKERKGAMRELRKDANFMAREKLRIKKAKDEAYEKKFKRIVSEIQSEEGREANAYEREKSARKRARNR
ncbi:nucleolar protein [Metarhizium album ARSEF 1941]|uniref:Nucleolar protein n=1 Tax=Metarhizium album (strain ARSEF 1941) TaxID=1081103 RepID=A0A0B2WQL8_METAS|nr:nucleolar protein [Metarhizium album ARSEF 1941]KHN96308.1 nucleolar protein [Metarhizium album ARSEF 1941]